MSNILLPRARNSSFFVLGDDDMELHDLALMLLFILLTIILTFGAKDK